MDGLTPFWELGLAALSMVLLFFVLLLLGEAPVSSASPKRTGSYRQYQGEAVITLVAPVNNFSGAYEIKFSFHPRETVREEFIKHDSRQWSLFRKDFSSPKKDFIKRYCITTGKRLPCTMHVIEKGGDPPVLFYFPTIDDGRGR